MTAVLGVNPSSRDTAACVLVDGEPLVMIEQERVNRERQTGRYPIEAIEICLAEAGIEMNDVDAVAMVRRPQTDLARGLPPGLRRVGPERMAATRFVDSRWLRGVQQLRRHWRYRGPVHPVGHHRAHEAVAFYPSPFERAAILTLERAGDGLSTTVATGGYAQIQSVKGIRRFQGRGLLDPAVTAPGKVMSGADHGEGGRPVLVEAAVHVGLDLARISGLPNLCLSGGVALDPGVDTQLLERCGFDRIFVQPAASDAGGALGAALWVWHEIMDEPRKWTMDHAYLGCGFEEEEAVGAFRTMGVPYQTVSDPAAVASRLLAEGKVVGWFQGRAEVGPRALGNRSVLADPRHAVDSRDWVCPFGLSALAEHGAAWFEPYHPSPFMLLVQNVREERRSAVPAVTDVDGSAPLQTVTSESNPLFHSLIQNFYRATGVPMVLNTSFNLRGEPVVHRPIEAIEDYLRSGMDAVFIGDRLAQKRPRRQVVTGGRTAGA